VAEVDPVFASERNRSHGVFGEIGRQFQLRVIEQACEFLPERQRVVGRLGGGARRQTVGACGFEAIAQGIEQWRCLAQPQFMTVCVTERLLAGAGVDGEQRIDGCQQTSGSGVLWV